MIFFPNTVVMLNQPICRFSVTRGSELPPTRPQEQQDVQQLTAIGPSVGWSSRAMNTTEICQTRQPWCCDQQSFLTAAVILAFKGILRQIYVGPAVRLCVHSFVGDVSGAPCSPLAIYPTRHIGNVACFVWPSCRSRSAGAAQILSAMCPSIRPRPPTTPIHHAYLLPPASPKGEGRSFQSR